MVLTKQQIKSASKIAVKNFKLKLQEIKISDPFRFKALQRLNQEFRPANQDGNPSNPKKIKGVK